MEVTILINRWRTKKVGFTFDMFAWFELCEMNDIEINQLGDLPQDKMFSDLIYCGYKSYCIRNRKRVMATPERLAEWVDKMTKGQAEELGKEIIKSKVLGKTVREWGDTVKKKQK